LVTGGCGFIGSHLVQLLVARGVDVNVLDRAAPIEPHQGANYTLGDVCDRALVRRLAAGVDQVFHLAADPNLWLADKSNFHAVNYHGTVVVLEEAARAGARVIVHTSTESILKGARRGNGRSADEAISRSLADMPGPYCRSKFLAEQAALTAAAAGCPVVVVNPTLPVGPGDHRLTPPTRMLLDFLNGTNPAYLDFHMNLIDVRDAALGHVLAAERGRPGERYILGGENLRLGEVLERLGQLSGLRMPRLKVPYALALAVAAVSEFIADHVTHRAPRASLTGVRIAGAAMHFDCSKSARELGLHPRPIAAALAEAVVWMAARGLIERPLPARLVLDEIG
jgi:dihydroflavonol-4-reductase